MITKNETESAATLKEETRTLKEGYILKYELCKESIDGRAAYSIRVTEYIDGEKVCLSAAHDITSLYETALSLFDIIVNGLVSPVTLHDVVYDLMP